jgi:hypothetical protein
VLQNNGYNKVVLMNPTSNPESVVDEHHGVWSTAGRKAQTVDASTLMKEDVETLTTIQLRAVLTAERTAHTETLAKLRDTEDILRPLEKC